MIAILILAFTLGFSTTPSVFASDTLESENMMNTIDFDSLENDALAHNVLDTITISKPSSLMVWLRSTFNPLFMAYLTVRKKIRITWNQFITLIHHKPKPAHHDEPRSET